MSNLSTPQMSKLVSWSSPQPCSTLTLTQVLAIQHFRYSCQNLGVTPNSSFPLTFHIQFIRKSCWLNLSRFPIPLIHLYSFPSTFHLLTSFICFFFVSGLVCLPEMECRKFSLFGLLVSPLSLEQHLAHSRCSINVF